MGDFERPVQYVKQRVIYEAYKTDEKNWKPYQPASSYPQLDNPEYEDPLLQHDAESDSEDDEEDEGDSAAERTVGFGPNDNIGFPLHQGEIVSTKYFGYMTGASFDADYEDISETGSVSLPYIQAEKWLYKGVRGRLSADWDDNMERDLTNLPTELLGFIVESTWSDKGMNIELAGMSKLLEPEYHFEFTQMLRSDIIKEVIKTAGLIPKVDPTGLDNQIMDYSNVRSTNDDEPYNDNLPKEACDAANKLIQGKTSQRDKAQAIYDWINNNCPYLGYSNSKYSKDNIYQVAIQNMGRPMFNCCDHAHLSVLLLRCVGFKANYIHVTGHVYTVVYIDGQRVMFDPLGYGKPMGSVASGYPKDGAESEEISF